MIIGITGKSGVGKTTYANKLSAETGFLAVHIDEISHQVMDFNHIKSALVDIFGAQIIQNDAVDRKYIGDLVFTNRHLYKRVSDLIWEESKKILDSIISNNENVILDWILLPHSHYWPMCDKKILITADEEIRKMKVIARDCISKSYLEKRDSASISYDPYQFDEIIENNYQ